MILPHSAPNLTQGSKTPVRGSASLSSAPSSSPSPSRARLEEMLWRIEEKRRKVEKLSSELSRINGEKKIEDIPQVKDRSRSISSEKEDSIGANEDVPTEGKCKDSEIELEEGLKSNLKDSSGTISVNEQNEHKSRSIRNEKKGAEESSQKMTPKIQKALSRDLTKSEKKVTPRRNAELAQTGSVPLNRSHSLKTPTKTPLRNEKAQLNSSSQGIKKTTGLPKMTAVSPSSNSNLSKKDNSSKIIKQKIAPGKSLVSRT